MKKSKNNIPGSAALRRQAEEQLAHRPASADIPQAQVDILRISHELQVHQVELELQNQELRQARNTLETRLEAYTALYDFAPTGYFTLDRQGLIQKANLTGAALLGLERSHLLQANFKLFVAPADRPAFTAMLDNLFSSGSQQTCEAALLGMGQLRRVVHIQAAFIESEQACAVSLADITALKNTETALRESENRFRSVVQGNIIGVVFADPDTGNITDANDEFLRIIGHGRKELISGSLNWKAITPAEVLLKEEQERANTLPGDPRMIYEKEYLRPDGTRIPVIIGGTFYDHTRSRVAAFVLDNSERKRAEAALRDGEERYRSVISAMAEGVVIHNTSGAIVSCNASAETILGLSAEQMMGKTPMDPRWQSLHEDGSPFPGETHPAALTLASGEPCANVIMGVHLPDDRIRWVSINSQPIFQLDSDRPAAVVATFIDITARRQAVEQIRFQAHLLSEVRQAVIAMDLNWRYLYWNRFAEELFGMRAQDVVGTINTDALKDNSLLTQTLAVREKVLVQGENWKGETHTHDRFGNPMILESTISLLKDESGQANGYICVIEEISQRKQAEESICQLNAELEQRVLQRTAELQAANQQLSAKITELEQTQRILNETATRYRIVADNTYDWEYWIDPQRQFIYSSPSCETVTAYRSQEFLDDPALLLQIIHPEDRQLYRQHEQDASQNLPPAAVEFRIIRKDGALRWIEHICQPVFDGQGRCLGSRGSNRDITERKRAEEALAASERQLALIYHNVSNSLFNLRVEPGGKYRFISINRVFFPTKITDPNQIVGKRLDEVVPEPFLSRALAKYQQAIDQRQTIRWEQVSESPSGPIAGNLAVTPIFDQTGRCTNLIGVVSDITALKRAGEEIQKQARRAEALVHTAAQFTAHLDLEAVFETICQAAVRALTASAADVRFYDEQRAELHLAASSGFSTGLNGRHLAVPRAEYDAFTAQFGTACIIADLQALPMSNAPLYKKENLHSMMAASIFLDQRLVGIISVFSRENLPPFGADDLSLLKALANQSAQAINNARLFEQISASQERLRILSQQLVEVQEAERRALALELHDQMGQDLNSAKLSMDMIPHLPREAGQKQYQQVSALLGELIKRVRRMSLELRPSLLDDLGLLPTLNWLFENYQERTLQPVVFQHAGLERDLSPRLAIAVYRIAQEALTNVIRHAGDKQVSVDLWLDEAQIHLRIADRGAGFDVDHALAAGKSTGLKGMRERARLLGGELEIKSAPGQGTTLTAHLPLTYADETEQP